MENEMDKMEEQRLEDYYHNALDQLEELIAEMHKAGIFETKTNEDFVSKMEGSTIWDDVVISTYSNPMETIIDLSYKNIGTAISKVEGESPKLETYVNYWVDDDDEPYEYNGHWYDEQRED